MNIVIFMKQAPNVEQKIRVKENGAIHESGLEYVISACDECAIEEALRIREGYADSEITLVTMGPARAKKALRRGLSLGADSALHILNKAYNSCDATVNARIFAAVLSTMKYDLLLFGKQAQDTDMQATAEILSEMLGLPMASNCVKVEAMTGGAVVHRQADRHLEVIEIATPCVISVNNDINNPRYPSLRSIISASMKAIALKKPTDFGLEVEEIGRVGSLVERVTYRTPRPRRAGKLFEGDAVENTSTVIELLAHEARVIG